MLAVLWIAGGASRSDALGQAVVRAWSWISLIVLALAGEQPVLNRARPVLILLLAAIALPLLQLIPLPPLIWQALPGRERFADVASLVGRPLPWRPLAIVPGATVNALSSLVVPLTMLLLAAGLNYKERLRLPGLMLILVIVSMVLGLAQFSGMNFNNPLINETVGRVSGNFANPNHFALFMAIGCLLAPVWALGNAQRANWRIPVALGLLLLLALTILASGSRAGMLLGGIGLCLGLYLQQSAIRRLTRGYPRWAFPLLIVTVLGLIVTFAFISFSVDRAQSLTRLFGVESGQDMRVRGFPIVLTMIKEYFPVGSGMGAFDPLFRLHEPFSLLKILYFNHAHNDFMEVVLDAGLAGLALVLAGCGWWVLRGIRVWITERDLPEAAEGRLGWGILALVLAASVVDYPARTPLMMAMIVFAAMLLSGSAVRRERTR
ncbi:O-antigen ligase family protein [Sphingomonas xinjiangensis]|uniref:O-antigen ligase n=1 Tax=Sphingomonas xinjiangensis TaxID=643568 RepID=A0A840YT00_9SPHN|nr:O-antigen ligase family protein [Sphingomonas xinjiangensis]MBB5712782.1 O-antigen ligase [Sphingomonas xinjiangensis]